MRGLMNFDPFTTFNSKPTNGNKVSKVTMEWSSVMSHLICSGRPSQWLVGGGNS